MKKTTMTMLMAAGLVFLAGCKTEVMGDRHFQGDPPQDDPVQRKTSQDIAPMPKDNKDIEKAPAPKKGYRPMEGTFGNEGVEKAPARRRAAKRARAAKGAAAAAGGVYIVKPGDTLGRIAYRHRVTVKALRQANNRTPAQDRFLRPGTKLVIPGGKAAPAGKGKYAAPAPRRGKNAPKLNADGTYTMVRGDNIPKVARKFGIRAKALQRANNLTDAETTRLQIGHKLIIPTGDDARVTARKKAPRKAERKAQRKAVEQKPEATPPQLPPPAAADAPAAPALPPPAANEGTATLPPPAPAATDAAALPPPAPATTGENSGTSFVSVAGFNSLEEFAAKHNTTVDELVRLNPRIDRTAPISSFGMLYVPNAAK